MARGWAAEVPVKSAVISSPLTVRASLKSVRLLEAVGLQRVAVGAVRHRADRRAHRALGAAEELVAEGIESVQPVVVEEPAHPGVHQLVGAHLRPDVAHRLVGRPHVGADEAQQGLVRLAPAPEPGERDVQALLEELARLDGPDAAADVGHVRGGGGEGDQPVGAALRWKIGFTSETSLMCPVPCQGSLVMRTSPGRIRSGPISRRKWRTVAGRVPMKDGMLPEFWASA